MAFAAQTSSVFTAVGAHVVFTCPNGVAIEDHGVTWLSGNYCQTGYNVNGKRYVCGNTHITHLKGHLSNQLRQSRTEFNFIEATQYSQPAYDSTYQGITLESIVGEFAFQSKSAHYATIDNPAHGALYVNGVSGCWITPGSVVQVYASPEQGYHLKADSIVITETCGNKAIIPVDDNNCFTMPDACITISAEFVPDQAFYTAIAMQTEVTDHHGTVQSSSEEWFDGPEASIEVDGVKYIPGDPASELVNACIQNMRNKVFQKASDLDATASIEEHAASSNASSVTDIYTQYLIIADLILNGHWLSAASTSHGSISVETSFASAGDSVTVAVIPEDGYEIKDNAVTIVNTDTRTKDELLQVQIGENGKATFTMPDYCVEVSALFDPVPAVAPTNDDPNSVPPAQTRIYPATEENPASAASDDPAPTPIETITESISQMIENADEQAIANLVSISMAVIGVGCAAGSLFMLKPPR